MFFYLRFHYQKGDFDKRFLMTLPLIVLGAILYSRGLILNLQGSSLYHKKIPLKVNFPNWHLCSVLTQVKYFQILTWFDVGMLDFFLNKISENIIFVSMRCNVYAALLLFFGTQTKFLVFLCSSHYLLILT